MPSTNDGTAEERSDGENESQADVTDGTHHRHCVDGVAYSIRLPSADSNRQIDFR